jgi:hypothetical protein
MRCAIGWISRDSAEKGIAQMHVASINAHKRAPFSSTIFRIGVDLLQSQYSLREQYRLNSNQYPLVAHGRRISLYSDSLARSSQKPETAELCTLSAGHFAAVQDFINASISSTALEEVLTSSNVIACVIGLGDAALPSSCLMFLTNSELCISRALVRITLSVASCICHASHGEVLHKIPELWLAADGSSSLKYSISCLYKVSTNDVHGSISTPRSRVR